jgi:hypothetical protein
VFVFADSKNMLRKPTNLEVSTGTDAIEAFLLALTDGDKCKAFGNGSTMRPWDAELLCAGARSVRNQKSPYLLRVCSRTLMGRFVPL